MGLTYSLTPKLEKLIQKLEKRQIALVREFESAREAIVRDPSIGKQLKGNLKELHSYDWTYQGHGIRVCYEVHDAHGHIQFMWFGTPENFYAEVARYLPSIRKRPQ